MEEEVKDVCAWGGAFDAIAGGGTAPVDTVVAVVLPSQLKVGEVQTSLDLVDSSVGVGTLLPPPAPAAEDYTRYCSAGVVVVPSSEVVQCLVKRPRESSSREKGDSEQSGFVFVSVVCASCGRGRGDREKTDVSESFSPHSNDSIPHLLDSLEEETEAHPRIECPVVERAAAGAAAVSARRRWVPAVSSPKPKHASSSRTVTREEEEEARLLLSEIL